MIREGQSTYGHPVEKWEAAKAEAIDILISVARKPDTITYSELTAKISSIVFEPHGSPFDHFLGQISAQEDGEGRGMLTAIVVHKTGDYMPGKGFYKLAKELGREFTDVEIAWALEVKRVYKVWKR